MARYQTTAKLAFRVYNDLNELMGATAYGEDAAMLVQDGGKIKVNSRIVWREGEESQSAAESYDFVAITIAERLDSQ